jgi:uncharacterized protein with HEPN domain
MRRERLYLTDILEASDAISTFLGGCSKDAFFESELIRSAVLHKLTVIGEAAARLPAGLRLRHPEVPWSYVVGSGTSPFMPTSQSNGPSYGSRPARRFPSSGSR